MAKSTRQYVFEGMEFMRDGLHAYVMRSLEAGYIQWVPGRVC